MTAPDRTPIPQQASSTVMWDLDGRRVGAPSGPSRADRARAAAMAPAPAPVVYQPDHRLSPRVRRKYLQYLHDFQMNRWLEARGTIPAHRTITKARKAELRECFKAVDQERVGLIKVEELGVAMLALGFSAEEAGSTMARAVCVDDPDHPEHDNRITPAEFTRLCVEAEAAAQAKGGSGSSIKPPGGQLDAGPLDVLIGSHRIRGLVERYMRDPVGASPLPSRQGLASQR